MQLLLLTLLAVLLPLHVAFARCSGQDVRSTLSQAEQTELQRRLNATPYPEGLHWIARKDDQEIHVVGTVHISDPRLATLMTRLEAPLAQASLVLVEGTEEEERALQAAMLRDPSLLYLTEGDTLPDLLPEPLWQTLSDAMAQRGYPPFLTAKTQPWFLSLLLGLPACVLTQPQMLEAGLDARIIARAHELGHPIRALEPYDTLFKVMGQDPLEEQIALLSLGILPEAMVEDLYATLLASYFNERPAEIFEINRILAKRVLDIPDTDVDRLMAEMLGKLLDERNLAWMPAITAAPDGVSVVAVGAGHLPGRFGLLALLDKEGYALTRQAP